MTARTREETASWIITKTHIQLLALYHHQNTQQFVNEVLKSSSNNNFIPIWSHSWSKYWNENKHFIEQVVCKVVVFPNNPSIKLIYNQLHTKHPKRTSFGQIPKSNNIEYEFNNFNTTKQSGKKKFLEKMREELLPNISSLWGWRKLLNKLEKRRAVE